MVDNFDLLANFISVNNEKLTDDNFYFLQLIRRSKDTAGLPSKTIRDFFIKNSADLLFRKDEIVEMCNFFNARAYFNPNVKSYEKCANYMLKTFGDMYTNKSFSQVKGMFTSAAGLVATRDTRFEKIWIIDYDYGELSLNEILDFILDNDIDYQDLKTKSGIHFLVNPFRTDICRFADKIQKHNPTILYVKD